MFFTRTGRKVVALGLATMLILSTSVEAQSTDVVLLQAHDAALGTFLTDENGQPLYFALGDEPGRPECIGPCLERWKPYVPSNVSPGSRPLESHSVEIVMRADGAAQATYRGRPLYTYVGDTEPFTPTANGADGVWFVMNVLPPVRVVQDAIYGAYLVGPTGMTLYTFDYDPVGGYECDGACSENFPPLVVSTEHVIENLESRLETMGVIRRGPTERVPTVRRQVTYDGRPLYYWSRDSRPGDTSGDGIAGLWRIARP